MYKNATEMYAHQQDELNFYKHKLSEVAQDKMQVQNQAITLDKYLKEVHRDKDQFERDAVHRFDGLQREINYRESEITKLNTQLVIKERTVGQALVSDHLSKVNEQELSKEFQKKTKEAKTLEEQLREAHKRIDELVMQRKAEGTTQLQIEHYKQDNKRLIDLLSTTDKFKNFA